MKCLSFLVCFLIALNINHGLCEGESNETINVIGLYNPPWFMSTADDVNDEDQYEGYLVDMLNELSRRINVKFNINFSRSQLHGSKNESGHWTGIVGEVMNGEADLGVADLTITSEREQVIDFSLPFANTGIGVLIKRPPYYLISNDSDVRDTKIKPLIIYPVSTIEDLTRQNFVKYGSLQGGSTRHFFATSTHPIHKKIGDYLLKQTHLPQSYGEAAHEVYESDGKYVFFMEEMSIDYLTGKDCDYARFDESLGSRDFGIAMRKGFHLKSRINAAINELHEEGLLKQFREKWFSSPLACNISIERIYKSNILDLVINGLK